jgi:hypothetical protein
LKEKELLEYVPPKAMRMAAMSIGAGRSCNEGGDADSGGGGASCTHTGSSAIETCTHFGNNADNNCTGAGNSVVHNCNPGNSD